MYYLSLVSFPRLTTQPRVMIPSVTARPAPADISNESALCRCPTSTGRSPKKGKEWNLKLKLPKEPVKCLIAHGIKYNNNILDIKQARRYIS